MNFEGLRRRGFSPERIAAVKAMHKALYRDDLKLDQAVARIADQGEEEAEIVEAAVAEGEAAAVQTPPATDAPTDNSGETSDES